MKHFGLPCILLLAVLFSCSAQSESYYYDTAGNKITGIIEFVGNGSIIYKENKKAKKINLTPDGDISSFVVGADSFAISMESTSPFSAPVKRFVHVLENGKIKLYDFSMLFGYSFGKEGKNENPYYFIEKNGEVYKINEIGWMYNFKKTMHGILSDYPQLEDEYIKTNKLYISNLRFIVQKYNRHFPAR